ncbi:hypothetical protein AB0J72_28660 [Dactylosporangium sp. NPDC049742]|uniref:hypothetical protein n=1 Tax=Dactylosporangium sp. NPDC049742 TaxID=3154737 RepID=UPI003417F51E
MLLVEAPRDDQPAVVTWVLVSVGVVVAMLCCLGGCVLLLIAPDQVAALSPFNWW